jgi:hypothetical protein
MSVATLLIYGQPSWLACHFIHLWPNAIIASSRQLPVIYIDNNMFLPAMHGISLCGQMMITMINSAEYYKPGNLAYTAH